MSFYREAPYDEDDPPTMELNYQYPDVQIPPSFQGYLGFARLKIVDVTSENSDILRKFHGLLLWEQEELDIDRGRVPWWGDFESPPKPMHSIVVVNREFDVRTNHFYVRYNEEWNDEQPGFWPGEIDPARHGRLWPRRYQPHVATADAVLEDWTGGPRVAPLQVRLPESITYEITDGRREVVESVEVSFKDVAVVGFPTANFRDIFSQPLNSTFFVATCDGVSRFRWVLGEDGRVLREEVLYKGEE